VRWISVSLAVAMLAVFLFRPQAAAAITVLPAWAWLALGLLLLIPKPLRSRPAIALWLLFALLFTDELRGLVPRPEAQGSCVVAFNCAGRREAIQEALQLSPDVLLLSEVPPRFQAPHGYHAVIGPDTALLARRPLKEKRIDKNWVQAETDSGLQLYSARLIVGVLRADLWSPDCWRDQAFNRATREESLQQAKFAEGPVLFGGDMNAPAGDGAFTPLRQQGLQDVFPLAGAGWGNTIMQVHRIDQLWVRGLTPTRLETRPSRYSDHRLTIAWFKPGD
jgi:hypothetical protein